MCRRNHGVERVVYLLYHAVRACSCVLFFQSKETYDLALVFLLLRLRRLTLFFLHLALILETVEVLSVGMLALCAPPVIGLK